MKKSRMREKIMCLALTSVLMLTLIPVFASADWVLDEENEWSTVYIVDGEFYVEDRGGHMGMVLVGYRGTSRDIVIPDGVTSTSSGTVFIYWDDELGDASYNDLLSVVFPPSLINIYNDCFDEMPNLASVTILNPDAQIPLRMYPIYHSDDPTDWETGISIKFSQPGLTIYSFPGGAVEEYANEHGINFVTLDGDAPPIASPEPQTVNPTASTVIVNGTATAFEAYLIGGNNFFKLRDLAYALNGSSKQFAVGWDEAENAISLTSGGAYETVGGEMAEGDGTAKTANPTTSRVFLDGQELSLTAYNIAGNNFFRLRDLMSALDIGVTWDDATSTIGIDASISYSE